MTPEEYALKEKALFDENKVPEEFRARISHLAWEHGHAYGYQEVYGFLQDFVCDLIPAINKFAERMNNER